VKTNVIGWVARVLSVLGVGIILVFMIGEGFNPAHMSPHERWLVLGFPIGVCVGMVVGWFREGLGGLITALSLAFFSVVHYAQRGSFPGGWWFLIFSSGGLLYLPSWLYTRLRKAGKQ
jgi:hypothetical protein